MPLARLAARLAQQRDRLGRGVLLAAEAGDEAPAADLAARLEAPAAHQQVAPRRQPLGLAREQPPEHHAPAAQQRPHQVLDELLAPSVIGPGGRVRARDPRPAPGGIHPEERDASAPAAPAERPAAVGGHEERAQPREAVGIDEAERHELTEGLLGLRGQERAPRRDLIEERGAVG